MPSFDLCIWPIFMARRYVTLTNLPCSLFSSIKVKQVADSSYRVFFWMSLFKVRKTELYVSCKDGRKCWSCNFCTKCLFVRELTRPPQNSVSRAKLKIQDKWKENCTPAKFVDVPKERSSAKRKEKFEERKGDRFLACLAGKW